MSTPPPPPPYSPGPYAQPGRDHPNGTTVLVLGILSLVVCGVLGPFAWNMGNKALREIDANPGVVWNNRGNVNAGRICGIIGTVLMALQVVVLLVVFGAVISTSS